MVAYVSPFGQCYRQLVCPANHRTPAQQHMRAIFGGYAQMWSRKLTEAQRTRWNAEGAEVWSHPRLGQRGKRTGEQFFTGINSVLACCNLPPVWMPPSRVVFQLSVVRELVVTHDEGGVRLFLRLAGAPTEDVMVFGQAPCSAGRSKRRNVSYLGLLPQGEDGMSEITNLYTAKFGEPRPGTKVFIVTCQQKNGWKGMEQETSEIVPMSPAQRAQPPKQELNELSGLKELNRLDGLEGADGAQGAVPTTVAGGTGLKTHMYKGCTRGAQGTCKPADGLGPEAGEGAEMDRPGDVPAPGEGAEGKT